MFPNGGSTHILSSSSNSTSNGSSSSSGPCGDVYRRLQDPPPPPEADERSISSTSNETDADEYHSLIDDSYRKTAKGYEARIRSRNVPSTGGNNCTRNRLFLCAIGLFSFVTLLLMNLPLGTEKGRVGTIAGWSANTSRQTVAYVMPSENTTLIEPLNVCTAEERTGDGTENDKVFLLIVVSSSGRNFEARQTIRETWGNVSEFNYATFAQLHARQRGEYLPPRPVNQQRFGDYMQRRSGGSTTAETVQRRRRKRSVSADSQSSNKSSQQSSTPLPSSTTTTTTPSPLEGQNFNVKIVFLLGQSEADYRLQHRQPPVVSTTATGGGGDNSAASGTPRPSLFQPGGDVDPAFNVRHDDDLLDEVQRRIVNESEVYGDIIQESFIDSYNNLTLKTIMMLKWVTNNCDGRVKYIMKCDDDTFVNVPNLLQVLLGGTVPLYKASIPFYDRNTVAVKSPKNRLVETKRLLTGFLFCEVKPIADTSSKWYSPNYMYGKEFYPNYLSGSSYLMSLSAAKLLYRTALTTPIFHLEDVYLTGIVAERVHLHRYHHPLFFYSTTKDLCALRGMISQHQLQPADLRAAYDFVTNGTIVCNGPERNFSMAKMKLQVRKKCQ